MTTHAEFRGVHHITFRVTDLVRSRKFYEEILDLVVDQWHEDKLRVRLGQSPTATRLVLRPLLDGTPAGDRFSERRIGLDHVAIAVADRGTLDRLLTRLRAAGVPTAGVQDVPGGGSLVAFRDPDNIQLEFFVEG